MSSERCAEAGELDRVDENGCGHQGAFGPHSQSEGSSNCAEWSRQPAFAHSSGGIPPACHNTALASGAGLFIKYSID